MKVAFLFPGQASQYVGMGKDLWERFPQVKAHYQRTDEILGADIAQLSFHGPEELLNQTANTQPAIFALSAALWQLLEEHGVSPSVVAGHSLGEYNALVAAGVLSYQEALRLVQLRGHLMQQAGERQPGTMAAVIGLSWEKLHEVCRQASQAGLVQVANFNSPAQLVISGEIKGVRRAMELAKDAGAKRVLQLPVSGAFHSPLMEFALGELSAAIGRVQLSPPRLPMIANVTAQRVAEADQIPQLLAQQLVSPVKWYQSIERMVQMGTEMFVEVGPGKVLQGLMRRIVPDAKTAGVADVETLESFLSQ